MIIQPTLPGGFVIFCDDIREEVNGKFTFVGTYAGEMTIFGAAPVILPKICVAVRLRVNPAALPQHIVFKITKETEQDSDTLLEAPLDAPAPPEQFKFPENIGGDGFKFIEIGFNTELVGITFPDISTIRVRALIGEDELRVGALTVKVAAPVQVESPV